jgi:hypothetical protein
VSLAAYKEHVAVERGLVAADLAAATRGRARASPATLARLGRVVALQDAALQSFLAFAPRRFVTSYAKHAALPCVHDAVGLRTALSEARGGGEPDHARWFAVQSCRIDSLQAMMDDLQTAVHASALASQRSGLWRLLYLGVPLVAILLAGASLGLEALGGASPRVPRFPRPRAPPRARRHRRPPPRRRLHQVPGERRGEDPPPQVVAAQVQAAPAGLGAAVRVALRARRLAERPRGRVTVAGCLTYPRPGLLFFGGLGARRAWVLRASGRAAA